MGRIITKAEERALREELGKMRQDVERFERERITIGQLVHKRPDEDLVTAVRLATEDLAREKRRLYDYALAVPKDGECCLYCGRPKASSEECQRYEEGGGNHLCFSMRPCTVARALHVALLKIGDEVTLLSQGVELWLKQQRERG